MDLPFVVAVVAPLGEGLLLSVIAVFTFLLAPAALLSPLIGDGLCNFLASVCEAVTETLDDFNDWVDRQAVK